MPGLSNEGRVPEFSPWYYGICTLGGMFSAGTTHLVATPLDVLKVNMQVCCVIISLLFFFSEFFFPGFVDVDEMRISLRYGS